MILPVEYPGTKSDRDQWILAKRGRRTELDSRRPYASFLELEAGPDGTMWQTLTVLLTNAECPFRCVMCDLWKNTLQYPTPAGHIAEQVRAAIDMHGTARQIKLYNAGSFFDPRAISPLDYAEIAQLTRSFERVVVECHPKFVGRRTWDFNQMGAWDLEVALGLETVHPSAFAQLNKSCELAEYANAAHELIHNQIRVRSFVLCGTPFIDRSVDLDWTKKSIDHAFEYGSGAVCVIPVRGGNGAMEALESTGQYHRPSLDTLEQAHLYGLRLGIGRMFADLWDAQQFYNCKCSERRVENMNAMNSLQAPHPLTHCTDCSGMQYA